MYNRLYYSLIPIVNYFPGWTASPPVVPEIYFNVYSAEQRWKWIACTIEGLICYVNSQADSFNIAADEIEKLKSDFEKFKESGFDDYYAEQVANWIDTHLEYVFDKVIKQIYFGLTDTGYFCAYVPDSWSDIEFDTGAVYGQFDYGRLIMRFNADGSGVIDNTGRYDQTDFNELKQEVERIKTTLYTALGLGGN